MIYPNTVKKNAVESTTSV